VKTLISYTHRRPGWDYIRVALEFKKEDLWMGAFWKTSRYDQGRNACFQHQHLAHTDVWVCFLPCLPIHITDVRMRVS